MLAFNVDGVFINTLSFVFLLWTVSLISEQYGQTHSLIFYLPSNVLVKRIFKSEVKRRF